MRPAACSVKRADRCGRGAIFLPFLRLAACAGLLLFLSHCRAPAARGQVETGTIAGVVTDSSGAAVPGAQVTITSVARKTSRTTAANHSGDFSVPFLGAGFYDVQVSKAGFQTFAQRGLALQVAQTLRVNVTLKVGPIRQVIEILAATLPLQTDDATMGQVIARQEVEALPLNGRNFLDLASLAAGTANHEPGARNAASGGFSSNGARSYDNNIMLDGVDNNNLSPDLRNGTDFIVKPPPDAISEFKVETNGYGPEFGRGGGAAVNVATKPGTDEFHGDAWEFLRNNVLDARNFFDYTANGAPPFKQNQFGAAGGGPVLRHRTFFFADYEGTRVRQSESFVSIVPTAQEKLGDFSDGFLGRKLANGTFGIIDPASGQPFANQQIPAAELDPVALKVAQVFPDPNIAGTNRFAYNPVRDNDVDQFDVRLDHDVNQATPTFLRVNWSRQNLRNPGSLPGLAIGTTSGATTGNTAATREWGAALGITHVFSSTVVNDFRSGYARLAENQAGLMADMDVVGQFGIPGIPFVKGVNGGMPVFLFSDVRQLGAGRCVPTVEVTNVFTLRDVLSVVHGRHVMKMGAELRPSEFTILQPCGSNGQFSYRGQFTGSGFADFLMGMPVAARLASFHNIDYRRDNYAAFWGDTWRIASRLTLNLGARWEYHTPIWEKSDAQASLGLDNETYFVSQPVVLPATFPFQVEAAGHYLNEPHHNDWAPRLGVNYQLTPKTVVRSAYGIFWQAEEIGAYSNPSPGFNPPFYIMAQYNAVSSTGVNPIVNQLGKGFPANAASSGFDPTRATYTRLQSNLADAYIQSWNLTVQRELGPTTSLEIAYVGNKGTHLINSASGNQASPSADPSSPFQARRPMPELFAMTFDILSNAYSNYNGFAVTLRRRLSRGLALNAAYTWSHALDLQSDCGLGSANNGHFRDYNHQDWEYGNADFDARHRFTLYYDYDLPVGRGRRYASSAAGALNAVIGGWKTLGIWTYRTGNWFTPGIFFDPSNSGSQSPRPEMICDPNKGAPHTTAEWFNTACFVAVAPTASDPTSIPAQGTFGNTGRNVILGPDFFSSDVSLMKHWSFDESRTLEFRAEFFNAFNHPTFPQIDLLTAGVPGFGGIQTANAPRQIQLALKFYW